ncbi:MAG: hypothetical protein AB7O65_09645 [Candidatus Korobacteraceae bacterium]
MLAIVVAHLVAGVFVHTYWLYTGDTSFFRYYFGYQGSLVLIGFSALEVVFAYLAYREFCAGQPLGASWLCILIAGACHFCGSILVHLLSTPSAINPLVYLLPAWNEDFANLMLHSGRAVGGPVQMAFLLWGLFLSLRFYRRMGMLAKLQPMDKLLACATLGYAALVIGGIIIGVRSQPGPVQYSQILTWPNDYLLSILLLEAIFLRRSALEMGWGYTSKVWGAFTVAIFLTSLCSLLNWLTAYGVLDWRGTAFVWYLWYPASAAFAIAPAYQWEATHTAQVRLMADTESLQLTTA